MKDLATSDSLCKKIACSPFLRVRLVTIYFAKNWKHCNKIIFKYMKNYCSLYFLLFISLKSLFMDNEQCQTRIQENFFFFENAQRNKTRPWTWIQTHTKSIPGHSLKFQLFQPKSNYLLFIIIIIIIFFFFFFGEEAMSTQINNIWFSKVKITICQILKSHAASTALLCKC